MSVRLDRFCRFFGGDVITTPGDEGGVWGCVRKRVFLAGESGSGMLLDLYTNMILYVSSSPTGGSLPY